MHLNYKFADESRMGKQVDPLGAAFKKTPTDDQEPSQVYWYIM